MNQQSQQNLYQDDSEKITVEVTDPKVKEGVQKYTTYSVRGMDKQGQFDVCRRYNEFQLARNILVTKWPGCYIPPLPQKKTIVKIIFESKGNMDQNFIDDRMKCLHEFCTKIASTKYLWYSDEFQIFVRSTNPDIEKTFASIPKITNQEIIDKYQTTFAELSGKEINSEIVNKIQEFTIFLKKVSPMVENFKQIAKNISRVKTDRQESTIQLLTSLLPDYEKNLILVYGDGKEEKLIIANCQNDQQLEYALDAYRQILKQNEFTMLYEQIRLESKQLEAFRETVSQREKYEQQKEAAGIKQKELQLELSKILAGKTTLKSIFRNATKEDTIQKLQYQIDANNKEIENTSFICDILTVLLGHIEIDRFKNEKQHVYYIMVKKIIIFEIQLAKANQEFWERIQQNYYLI